MGKFIISKKNYGFQLLLKSNNGLALLTSEGFTAKSEVEKAMDAVIRYAKKEALFEYKQTPDQKYFFVLKSPDGVPIATSSQSYSTLFACGKGIEAVQSNISKARIDDKTCARNTTSV